MGIIIGAATTVSFSGACVTQVQWSSNPNVQRLYCLGSWTPQSTIEKPTETLSVTIYSDGPSYSVAPSTSCELANTISADVSPAGCGTGVSGPSSSSWYVNSYSYSKEDANMPGTESWSMIQYTGTGNQNPKYVIRGISEGSATQGIDTGITFAGTTTTSSQGSVSAGQVGKSDITEAGVVSSVGGGSTTAGVIGNGSVSIPYTPLWI